jgi:C_GCAxxG_C_C family probable redox protein
MDFENADVDDRVRTAYEKGRDYEARATDCCQCTIAAVQEAVGCEDDVVLRSGSAFAGGVAFTTRGHCGALTGGVMVIGQLCGRSRDAFDADAEREVGDPDFDYVAATKGWDHAYELVERFVIEYGSPICREISDQVIGRMDGEEFVRPDSPARSALSKHRTVESHDLEGCPTVVGNAAAWTTEIVLREGLHEAND